MLRPVALTGAKPETLRLRSELPSLQDCVIEAPFESAGLSSGRRNLR
jgi:hypothetical protein